MTYGAGAAGFSPRDRAALALIFGMHILGLFAWMQQRPARLPTMPRTWSPSCCGRRRRRPQTRIANIRRAAQAGVSQACPSCCRRSMLLSAALAAPAPVTSSANRPGRRARRLRPCSVIGVEAAGPPASVQDAIREQQQADGGFGLNLSRRQAGRIDRELRKGKSGVPDEPDTPMGRFRRGLEAAHVERSMSVQEDSYTSPDGVVIYRTRIGKTEHLPPRRQRQPARHEPHEDGRRSGDNIPCPSGVDWKKD
jgi:hypothetical protein